MTVPRWLLYLLVFFLLLLVGLLVVFLVPAQQLARTVVPLVVAFSSAGAVFFIWRWWGSRGRQTTDIERLDWSEFQPLLCQFLERQGYILVESGNRPGIVDLVVRKDRQTSLVHAKSWNAGKLDLGVVSKLYDAMLTRGVTSGIVVSGSKFGRGAQAFARETQIQLIDGALLRLWFKRHLHSQARMDEEQAKLMTVDPVGPEPLETRMLPEFFSPVSAYVAPMSPLCPLCSAPMKERKARKGRHAGTKFWGCTRSPKCKGIKRWGEA